MPDPLRARNDHDHARGDPIGRKTRRQPRALEPIPRGGKDPGVEKLVGLAYMVADGNRYVRSTIKDALHGMGIRAIVEMDSGEEALGHVEKHAVDAILVGYEMAGMSGAEFAWRLRRNGRRPASNGR